MNVLGLDVGSSSVKAGVLVNGKVRGQVVRCAFPTRYDGSRAEVDARAVLQAVADAIRQLGPRAGRVDVIAPTVMAPSWVAIDGRGRPLTPIVTHQDRRSVEMARDIESRVGKARHLKLAGNRPFPGGISSTTAAWFRRHHPDVLKRADLLGHLGTFLHRVLTGARVTDPSNASFMGLYETLSLGGWNGELCDAAGVSRQLLPEVREASEIGGTVTAAAARRFGLKRDTPVLVGCMDTSAALLLAGAEPGRLLNVSGSTDVLALCTDRPRPHQRLLTRAVGVGRCWMSVSTLAAAGSALGWVRQQFFCDMPTKRYHKLMADLANRGTRDATGGVVFEPYLAGERTSLEQRRGAFTGLTLSTTREQMLAAVIEALAKASAERLELLRQANRGLTIRREVFVSGGVQSGLAEVIYRDWPGRWSFREEEEATLRGLGRLAAMAKAPA